MLDNRSKLILVICLLLGIPLLIWRSIIVVQALKIAGDNREQLPIRTFRITVDPNHQQELFDQFHKFAEEDGFQIEISDYGTDGETYLIWMLRDDIKIIASHIRQDRDIVTVSFYDETGANPIAEKTLMVIENLLTDLKNVLREIPGVTITEEQD